MLLLIKPGKGMFHWKNVLRRLPSSSVRSVRLFSLRPLEEAGRPTESFSCGAGEQQTSHPSHPPSLSLSIYLLPPDGCPLQRPAPALHPQLARRSSSSLVVVLGFGRRASPVSPQPLFLVRPEREREGGRRSSVLGVFLDWIGRELRWSRFDLMGNCLVGGSPYVNKVSSNAKPGESARCWFLPSLCFPRPVLPDSTCSFVRSCG